MLALHHCGHFPCALATHQCNVSSFLDLHTAFLALTVHMKPNMLLRHCNRVVSKCNFDKLALCCQVYFMQEFVLPNKINTAQNRDHKFHPTPKLAVTVKGITTEHAAM
eukprot:5872127-Amphidinium_carterae.1